MQEGESDAPADDAKLLIWKQHSIYLHPWPFELDAQLDMSRPIDQLTRPEKIVRLRHVRDVRSERWDRAEEEVPRDGVKCERLRRAVGSASRALNSVVNDWFPPAYADCVDGYDMCIGGPNEGKIRPWSTKGPWRPLPRDPFSDLYE